jgi:hypothetical protein
MPTHNTIQIALVLRETLGRGRESHNGRSGSARWSASLDRPRMVSGIRVWEAGNRVRRRPFASYERPKGGGSLVAADRSAARSGHVPARLRTRRRAPALPGWSRQIPACSGSRSHRPRRASSARGGQSPWGRYATRQADDQEDPDAEPGQAEQAVPASVGRQRRMLTDSAGGNDEHADSQPVGEPPLSPAGPAPPQR